MSKHLSVNNLLVTKIKNSKPNQYHSQNRDSNQNSVTNTSSFSFANFNLHPQLMNAIATLKYHSPTEIQKRVIPIIMGNDQDVMASAETGAGKTVAYLLPSLNRLLANSNTITDVRHKGRGPRVLILTPTRELADQVTDAIRKLAKFTQLKMGTITGGVPYFAQEQLLKKSVDLLVATPGRLMDHMEKGRVDFSRLEIFILDEADRMLDMGFIHDIEYIMEQMPSERQILLFSATLEGQVQRIARRYLTDPILVQINEKAKPSSLITQKMHQADDFSHKRALLLHILKESTTWQTIVFTATKRGADELVDDLREEDIVCAALHGDMKQRKRSQTLDRMRSGKLPVLVATDVASRGIDVKNLSHVINFDLPRSVDDYIHRIGRTGRCGEKGTAISLVGPKEWSIVSMIERVTGQKLERQIIVGLEPRKVANKPTFRREQSSSHDHSGKKQNKRKFNKNYNDNIENPHPSKNKPWNNFKDRKNNNTKNKIKNPRHYS